ncbi:FAD-binding oxidoreductase [Actinopolymorpha singaporensis]|uniref:FAD/FMN-containing dehydrogenase n=1 Tax=Actinopolymorpha singaporensis TaxID=117157 RepID=A0A1H1MW40_9ACTN|nr:FAD-binding oxidoreductase [Actinopolymorpha singaporensis]SDR91093.1 FAD/FMN-containing dehydrogenase [Actinopolymorpha singaporensis]
MGVVRLHSFAGDLVEVPEGALERFADELRGRLIQPIDPEYDTARSVWNGLVDKRPGLIARCADSGDVATAVNFAREHDLLLAVRGGGHNVSGIASCDGGLVVDLSPMSAALTNPATEIVRAQGGVRIADLDQATQPFDLAVPMGVVSDTGAAGLTLGGGFGWLFRKHGLSCDNLLAAEVVTSDGGTVRAGTKPSEDPDLLWALRGGGGNFGIVTEFEFRAHPVGPDLFCALVVHAGADAGDVLRAIRSWKETIPDEVTTLAILMDGPPMDGLPQEYVGRPVLIHLATYVGDPDEGERVLAAARALGRPVADLSGRRTYLDLQQFFDGDYPARELRYYWKSRFLTGLDDALIDTIVELGEAAPSPRSSIDVWPLGGAMARVPAGDTAFGDRSMPYMLGIEANWELPEDDDANIGWAREVYEQTGAYSDGREYLNFPGFYEADELTRSTFGDNYARLVELKRRFDPQNLFRLNHNIPPTG